MNDKLFPVGAPIFAQGDFSEKLFILCEGAIKLAHVFEHSGIKTVRLMGSGDLFGKSAFLKRPYRAYAEVLHHCRVLSLTPEMFGKLLCASPTLALFYMAYMAKENAELQSRLLVSSHGSASEALAVSLWYLVRRFGRTGSAGVHLDVKLPCQLLAETIGYSRQATNSALSALQRKEIIESHYGRILIRNLTALHKLAEPFIAEGGNDVGSD